MFRFQCNCLKCVSVGGRDDIGLTSSRAAREITHVCASASQMEKELCVCRLHVYEFAT